MIEKYHEVHILRPEWILRHFVGRRVQDSFTILGLVLLYLGDLYQSGWIFLILLLWCSGLCISSTTNLTVTWQSHVEPHLPIFVFYLQSIEKKIKTASNEAEVTNSRLSPLSTTLSVLHVSASLQAPVFRPLKWPRNHLKTVNFFFCYHHCPCPRRYCSHIITTVIVNTIDNIPLASEYLRWKSTFR